MAAEEATCHSSNLPLQWRGAKLAMANQFMYTFYLPLLVIPPFGGSSFFFHISNATTTTTCAWFCGLMVVQAYRGYTCFLGHKNTSYCDPCCCVFFHVQPFFLGSCANHVWNSCFLLFMILF